MASPSPSPLLRNRVRITRFPSKYWPARPASTSALFTTHEKEPAMTSTKLRLLLPALVSLCLPVMAQMTPTANRILAPIDEGSRVTLRGNVHPLAQAKFDIGPAQGSNATGRIALLLQRSATQQQALTEYMADLQNPSSPSYHKWLTPAQYGTRFGISDSDLATAESWLQAHGFKIEKVPQARNLIQFSGTFDQVQAAFHTSIHSFRINGQTHFANVSDPQIPTALAPVVAGVGPLNNFHPKSHLVRGPHFHWDAANHRYQPDLTLQDQAGNLYLVVDPADAATIYDSPNKNLNTSYTGTTNYDGTGINLGIVGNSDLTLADVTNYRESFLGETSGSLNLPTVVIDGNDPGLSSEADEALLDNEIAGGLAPKAKIYFYTAADTDLTSGLIDAAFRAIDDNTVSILSMSFGSCEAGLGNSGNQLIDEAEAQAAAQGISVVVSSGDNGSAGCDDFNTETSAQGGLAVSGYASTPYVIGVGGTDFDGLTQSNISTYVNTGSSGSAPYYETAKGPIPEATWNDSTTTSGSLSANVAAKDSSGNTNIVAGSGGVSVVYAKPSFQTSLTPSDGARDVPDVSLFAADGAHFSFWALCSDSVTDGGQPPATVDCQNGNPLGGIEGVGGTSAAAPAFAGMLALISQSQGGARLGQADYVLYQLAKSNPSAFHDVATSNNSVPCVAASPNCGTNGFLTGYNAGTGYDTATGLGSVDVNALVKAWSSATLASTSTSFNINGSTAAYTGTHGATVTFNVGVNPTSATGNVAIIDNANMSTSANSTQNNGQIPIALSGGSGSTTYNGLPGGSYTVYAQYGGDASDAESKSATIPVTIAAEPSTTILAVDAYDTQGNPLSSLSNIAAGDFVFLDAQIEGTAEGSNTAGVATGTVTFYNGSTQVGTAPVNSEYDLASYPPNTDSFLFLPAGNYNITAKYSGDASFSASTSTAISFTIAAASPAIALGNSGNITVTRGATTGNTSTITVTPSGGFTGTVNLTCAVTTSISSPNDPPTCGVTKSVSITGTTAATATVTASTTAQTSGALDRPLDRFFLGGGATLAMIVFFGIPARRRAWRSLLGVMVILFIGGAIGCGGGGGNGGGGGGGGNSGTTPGAYTITVTGADATTGKVTATTTVTLTVN